MYDSTFMWAWNFNRISLCVAKILPSLRLKGVFTCSLPIMVVEPSWWNRSHSFIKTKIIPPPSPPVSMFQGLQIYCSFMAVHHTVLPFSFFLLLFFHVHFVFNWNLAHVLCSPVFSVLACQALHRCSVFFHVSSNDLVKNIQNVQRVFVILCHLKIRTIFFLNVKSTIRKKQ